MASILVYGAVGYSGRLVRAAAEGRLEVEAAARRVPPEDAASCEPLALDDGAALRRALARHDAVLNCAGPFAHTWRPMLEACLETGTHYLDLNAEWAVFEALRAEDARARERGVMLLPGVGFDVVPSDCLAAHVAARVPGARRLEIGISYLEILSRGSAKTLLELAGEPVRVRRGGALVADSRLLEATFDFGEGPRAAYATSWGDISTAHHSTGIPDVAVYFEATPVNMGLALLNRSFGWLLRQPWARRLVEAEIALLPPGPPAHVRASRRAVLVARAFGAAGERAESRLTTPEAYSFSAATAVAAARRVLDGDVRPGFQTPSRLFGADFVLGFDGVERVDVV